MPAIVALLIPDHFLFAHSVQYLQQPERVIREVHRVLKPGGVCIFTFSNRMFYSKAIAAWRDASGYARTQLVKQYFFAVPVSAGTLADCPHFGYAEWLSFYLALQGFSMPETLTKVERKDGKPASSYPAFLQPLLSLFSSPSDPFYAVLAYREDQGSMP